MPARCSCGCGAPLRFPAAAVEHGYNRYTHGCRCDVCRNAKREYARGRRLAAARRRELVEADGGRYIVNGITHGYNGYQNHGCRCFTCRVGRASRQRGRVAGPP